MKNAVKRCVFLALSLVWMAVIFSFSAKTAAVSSEESGLVTQVVAAIMPQKLAESTANILETIIRKVAHFSEYTVLGIFVYGFFQQCVVQRRAAFCTAAVCAVYAVSDEVHQLFVDGRACRVADMLIDSAGAICGIFIYIAAVHILRKVQKNKCIVSKLFRNKSRKA